METKGSKSSSFKSKEESKISKQLLKDSIIQSNTRCRWLLLLCMFVL